MAQAQPTILIAEDNPGLAQVLRFKFKSCGFNVIAAADGQKAWELYQRHQPVAVVSDHEMPQLTGVDLFRKIRKDHQSVPLVLVTGRQLELVGTGVENELGLSGIYPKPFSATDIVSAVNNSLGLEGSLSFLRTDPPAGQAVSDTNMSDFLSHQVLNDFEELTLLRMLASTGVSSFNESADQLCQRFIDPLMVGLQAEAIVAVLVDQATNTENYSYIWSGQNQFDAALIQSLISQHAVTARNQPIVVNSLPPVVPTDHRSQRTSTINGFVLVECRSKERLHGWVMALNHLNDEPSETKNAQYGFTTVQASLMETATNQMAVQLQNLQLFQQKEQLFTDVVRALVNAIEARDPYTAGHSERVARFAKFLAKLASQSAKECERIYLTGLLHDVGKIAIPDGVLQKKDQLNDQEREIIETHTEAGWKILQNLDAMKDVLPGVLYHHEQFDGGGYPDGLSGQNIPIDGRILAVCDAFDAMTSDRPYRKGMPIEKACEILAQGAGTYWDPLLVSLFVRNIEDFNALRISHRAKMGPQRRRSTVGQPAFESVY